MCYIFVDKFILYSVSYDIQYGQFDVVEVMANNSSLSNSHKIGLEEIEKL